MGEIKDFLDRRPDSHGWEPIRSLMAPFRASVQGELEMLNRGPSNRYRRAALASLHAVLRDGSVGDDTILLTVGALLLQRKRDPWRFKSDDAFRCQVSRRFRGLNDAATVTVAASASDGGTRRYTRYPSGRTNREIGRTVITALGSIMLYVIEQMDREEAERREIRTKAFEALMPGSLSGKETSNDN
ncbi:hypothetical protein EN813_028095 [Mesorhizobium sp. M00.F.Ca.ET.170.01.1.1]|nr:hypothetical protein EN813_028095 [Mesorhizobium sp. M00.F.Ca.ET.170.01.1.1]